MLRHLCHFAVLMLWLSVGLCAADLDARLMASGGGSSILDGDIRDLGGTSHSAALKDRFQVGVLAAFDVHRPLALEAGFRIGNSEFRVNDGSLLPAGQAIGFTIQQLFCNAVYNTPYSGGGLRLFATGGIGLRRVHPESASGSDFGWSVNFGGGLEARASRRYSVRVEMRDFVGDMPRFVTSQAPGGFLHDIQTSIGLIVHLP